MSTHTVGVRGEALAADYLKQHHYTVLEQNYRTKRAEIDIIAMKEDTLVFLEVKARSSLRYGIPAAAVTAAKQARIRMAALFYLQMQGITDKAVRFDVIEVYFASDGTKMNHIENAF